MNIWLLAIVLDTFMIGMLACCVTRLDKKCWDLLSVIKGMSDHIKALEEKVSVVHSNIQE